VSQRCARKRPLERCEAPRSMSSRGLTLPGPGGPRSPARRPRRGDWPVAPQTRGPAEPCRSIPEDRLASCSPSPKARRRPLHEPRGPWNGCSTLPKERRAVAPPPRGAAKRLTGRDVPDLTANSSSRPPHHRRLRRVAPPAWPSSFADPALVAEGVRRFLVKKPLVPQGFPQTSLDDHRVRGVSTACRIDNSSETVCQHILSTECSTT
jgi:hypothetical protein